MTTKKRKLKKLLWDYDNPSTFSSSKVAKTCDQIARQLAKENVTLEDLLEIIEEERKILYQERYGNPNG
jgi:hypothetical protein